MFRKYFSTQIYNDKTISCESISFQIQFIQFLNSMDCSGCRKNYSSFSFQNKPIYTNNNNNNSIHVNNFESQNNNNNCATTITTRHYYNEIYHNILFNSHDESTILNQADSKKRKRTNHSLLKKTFNIFQRSRNFQSLSTKRRYTTFHSSPSLDTNNNTKDLKSSSISHNEDHAHGNEDDTCWVLFSDVHFHPTYLSELNETTDWIMNEIKTIKPSQIICLGDLINTRESVSVQALSAAVRFIDELSHEAPVHLLLGNHDMNLKHSHKISSLDILDSRNIVGPEGKRRIHLYRGIQFTELDGYRVCMAAYHENTLQALKKYLQNHAILDPSHPNYTNHPNQTNPMNYIHDTILFSHMAIQGAIMSFMKDQHGRIYKRRFDEDMSKSMNEALSSNPIFSRDLSRHELSDESLEQEDKNYNIIEKGDNDEKDASSRKLKKLNHSININVNHTTNNNSQQYNVNINNILNQKKVRIPSLLTKFRRVFSGHFHHHHSIHETITYCGAPMQHHFGDAGDSERGIVLFFPKTNTIQFIRNPNWDKYRMIRITNETDEIQLFKQIESYRNKYVSIGSTFSAINYNIERINQALLHHGVKSVRIQPLKINPSDMIDTNKIELLSPNLSSKAGTIEEFHDLLFQYGKENNLSNEMIQKGLEFITKTLEEPDLIENYHSGEIFRGRLQHVTIENFLSVQGIVEIPLDHMSPGVWYIQGENGSGKSVFFEAVSWGLFERFLRSDMKADYAINDIKLKDCRVKLQFSNGYTIERFRKYKSLGGNGVRVYKDGIYQEQMEKGHIRDSQKMIEEVIGIDFESFSKSMILSDQAIVFLGQDAKRRREFVEQLVGMWIFDKVLDNVKEARKKMDLEKSWIEAKISLLQQQLKEIEEDQLHHQKAEEVRGKLRESKLSLEKIEQTLKRFREEEKPQALETLEHIKQEWYEFENYNISKQFIELKEKLKYNQLKESENQNAIEQIQIQVSNISKDMFIIEEKISNLRTVIDKDHCTTCDRKIDEHQAHDMNCKIHNDLQPKLAELQIKLDESHQALKNFQEKGNQFLHERLEIQMELSHIASKLGISTTQNINVSDIPPVWYYEDTFPDMLQSETTKLKEREFELEKEKLQAEGNLKAAQLLEQQFSQRNESQKEHIQNQINNHRKQLVENTEMKPVLNFWEQAFSPKTKKEFNSFRSFVLDRTIRDLNQILKFYSNMLTVSYDKHSKPDIIISFDSEFQVNEAYGKRSAGQRKRNQLVIFFSLFELVRQRSRFQSNFLMLDEVFDSLDQDGQEDVQSCIRILYNQRNLDFIFVITHSPDVLQNVSRDYIIDVKASSKGSQYSFKTETV